jgi:hypothetical protein
MQARNPVGRGWIAVAANGLLDFISYAEYLETDHWKETRAAAIEQAEQESRELCGKLAKKIRYSFELKSEDD